jgi:nucleotide-binding universal stress UspA family protein
MSFLDPAIAVTLMDVAENGPKETHGQIEEAERVVELAAERARALGRAVECRVARGEAGPEIVRAAIDGKFDAIFMSLRGVYRRGDTTAFASNTRYVLEHAPCRVILGFAPKSIPTAPTDTKAGA